MRKPPIILLATGTLLIALPWTTNAQLLGDEEPPIKMARDYIKTKRADLAYLLQYEARVRDKGMCWTVEFTPPHMPTTGIAEQIDVNKHTLSVVTESKWPCSSPVLPPPSQ
jgi:hypothetical protein